MGATWKKYVPIRGTCTVCGKNYVKKRIKSRNPVAFHTCANWSCFNRGIVQKANKGIATKKNYFTKNIHKFHDKIIKYSDSETGKAYIGLAKKPLMPNDNGIGFKGVKLQTENRELLQCYECGEWVHQISFKHLEHCSSLSVQEYKEKYGFNKRTGLVSDMMSNKLAATMRKNIEKYELKPPEFKNLWKRDFRHIKTMEFMNNVGACPLQLKERLLNYIRRFHVIPVTGANNREQFDCKTYAVRFGSYHEALKAYKLPTRIFLGGSGAGARTQYTFPDGEKYITHRGDDIEIFYRVMLKKCPILSKNINENL